MPLVLENGNVGQLTYDEFLREKVAFDRSFGFDVDPADIHPILKPHQVAIVRWAVKGGRRAIFARFGLGKSVMQLETIRLILAKVGGAGLVVAPLGVRSEFIRDGRDLLGIEVRFIRRTEEIDPEWSGIYVTNYESIRDGRLHVDGFTAVSLDEAAVLASYGSKTTQEMLAVFSDIPFRFVATATPSPNEHLELINYAGFLGIMDRGAALTRFFQRDSTKAGELTLYPHKRDEFWLWLNTWACFVQRPSDLGFPDDGYTLPPLEIIWHEVETDLVGTHVERDGQGRLFRGGAMSSVEASKEKKDTIPARVALAMELVSGYVGGTPGVSAPVQSSESGSTERAAARAVRSESGAASGGDGSGSSLAGSAPGTVSGADHGEGSGEVGATLEGLVRGEQGPGAEHVQTERNDPGAVRRSRGGAVGPLRDLSDAADGATRGPRSRDGRRAGSSVPEVQLGAGDVLGRPDEAAGSDPVSDQIILWCDLNAEQEAIERGLTELGVSFSSIHGGLSDDEAERRLDEWRSRKTVALIGKPVMLGQGMNLQQCNKAIWVGVTYKFRQTIQSLHRVVRFGQARPVTAHFIVAETESEVRNVLKSKWSEHDELTERMSDLIRIHGLNSLSISRELTRSMGVERETVQGKFFTLALNDCVIETRDFMLAASVDLIVTSIPFGNHYEYSLNYADFGHTDDNDHFWYQMDYATPELYRVLKPGRIMAVHVKDRIRYGNVTGTGLPTSDPFHAQAIAHYMGHGFDYLGMITVTTDVVRENNQTYRLGYTKMLKDASNMGVGSPEYILLFHKPQTDRSKGWADQRIVHERSEYSLAQWQIDADAKWRSSGDRLLSIEEIVALDPATRDRVFGKQYLERVYDFNGHVALAEALQERNLLPSTFASMSPPVDSPWLWDDVDRMGTLNGEQSRRNLEFHICPLQFDIVERLIGRYSNPGDLVLDPFSGLGTVALFARRMGRRGYGIELNPTSHRDAVMYQAEEDRKQSIPSLFDLIAADEDQAVAS